MPTTKLERIWVPLNYIEALGGRGEYDGKPNLSGQSATERDRVSAATHSPMVKAAMPGLGTRQWMQHQLPALLPAEKWRQSVEARRNRTYAANRVHWSLSLSFNAARARRRGVRV